MHMTQHFADLVGLLLGCLDALGPTGSEIGFLRFDCRGSLLLDLGRDAAKLQIVLLEVLRDRAIGNAKLVSDVGNLLLTHFIGETRGSPLLRCNLWSGRL